MDAFFRAGRIWPRPVLPHVVVMLGNSPAGDYAEAFRPVLEKHGHRLGISPREALHLTVQGIHQPVTEDQEAALLGALQEAVGRVSALRVEVGPVAVGSSAVEAAVYPEDRLTELHDAVRDALTGLDIPIRPVPRGGFRPHVTLAYSTRTGPAAGLARDLARIRPPRPFITVDRVHLVQQTQRPDLGYYTQQDVHAVPLGTDLSSTTEAGA